MNRLSQRYLINPYFERKNLKASVIHFGPGAFHRAHQGYYFNLLNTIRPEFGIIEIALNSEDTIKSLKEQDNLYSITELGINGKTHIIGVVKDAIFAPSDPEKIFELLINPEIKIITSTITEKGYCLKGNGTLDFNNEGIKHDIVNPNTPQTYIGYVAYGLLQRYKAGIAPFIILPCDNISDNGKKVKNALVDFAEFIDPDFAQYLEKNLIAPSTMVDSITPKSDKILFDKIETEQGFSDEAAVWREEFTQWVIETYSGYENVPWAQVGVTLTSDVASYEQVKLRILNGAHSTLAYVGWCLGFETVAQAMANPIIEKLIQNLIFENIIPSLNDIENIDLATYANDIIDRFKNPIVQHKLAQIAWDGSQKIGFRLLPSIRQNLKNGYDISYLCLGIAGWFRFIIKMTMQNQEITDPMAKTLSTLADNAKDDESDITGFLALNEIFEPNLQQNPLFIKTVKEQYLKIIKTEIGGKIENL
jgi:fructuronate reductase